MVEDERRVQQADEVGPKIDEAFVRWAAYPRQCATGIASEYAGRHIREWHCGEMSSREFLELTDGLPPDSWLMVSFRKDLAAAEAEAENAPYERAKAAFYDAAYAKVPGGAPRRPVVSP